MLPYLAPPPIAIGPLRMYPFGLLTAAGIWLGAWMFWAFAPRRGLDGLVALRLYAVGALAGFPGGYLLRILFFGSAGLYSFGGLFCAFAAVWVYVRWRKLSPAEIFGYLDLAGFVFPYAWIL